MSEPEKTAEVEEQDVTEVKEDDEAAAEETTKTEKSDELKIVLILNPGKVMLGVQSTDCDPVYATFEGTLPTALKRIPKFVAEAKQKWSESPRYPDANLPTPEPARLPPRRQLPRRRNPSNRASSNTIGSLCPLASIGYWPPSAEKYWPERR